MNMDEKAERAELRRIDRAIVNATRAKKITLRPDPPPAKPPRPRAHIDLVRTPKPTQPAPARPVITLRDE